MEGGHGEGEVAGRRGSSRAQRPGPSVMAPLLPALLWAIAQQSQTHFERCGHKY